MRCCIERECKRGGKATPLSFACKQHGAAMDARDSAHKQKSQPVGRKAIAALLCRIAKAGGSILKRHELCGIHANAVVGYAHIPCCRGAIVS